MEPNLLLKLSVGSVGASCYHVNKNALALKAINVSHRRDMKIKLLKLTLSQAVSPDQRDEAVNVTSFVTEANYEQLLTV